MVSMKLPVSDKALSFLTNPDALAVHANGTNMRPFSMGEAGWATFASSMGDITAIAVVNMNKPGRPSAPPRGVPGASASSNTTHISFEAAGLDATTSYAVREVWGEELGSFTGSMPVAVAPYSTEGAAGAYTGARLFFVTKAGTR